jgi:hypothetical protein
LQGHYTLEILAMQNALNGLVPNIISLITFGSLFLYLGFKNKENFGKFLIFSAIFWIVCGIILLVPYSITFMANLPLTITFQAIQIAYILISIALIFRIISSVFFMIYAFKIDVKVLFYSSIFMLVASILFFVNSLVQISLMM